MSRALSPLDISLIGLPFSFCIFGDFSFGDGDRNTSAFLDLGVVGGSSLDLPLGDWGIINALSCAPLLPNAASARGCKGEAKNPKDAEERLPLRGGDGVSGDSISVSCKVVGEAMARMYSAEDLLALLFGVLLASALLIIVCECVLIE